MKLKLEIKIIFIIGLINTLISSSDENLIYSTYIHSFEIAQFLKHSKNLKFTQDILRQNSRNTKIKLQILRKKK
jgi:hypothetical protein